MSIESKHLLDFARAQLQNSDEASRRAGVSRAYYSCFHPSYEIADKFPSVKAIDDHLSHREIIHRFEAWNVPSTCLAGLRPQAIQVAQKLRVLRSLRVQADYELGGSIGEVDLKESISRAEELRKKVAQLKLQIGKC